MINLKDKNLYYVGGVVRDEILGTASFDTDFCYEGNAIEFAKKLGLNVVKENPDFGTVRVTPHPQPLSHKGRGELLDASNLDTSPQPSPQGEGVNNREGVSCAEIDIASTREEEYPKAGHLPVVKNIGCSLKDDLKRRDFTINAMAKNTLTGEITDYFGGMEDIKAKKLKVLHDKSFIDDPTRIVRGLKFAVRFGFELDEETKRLQDEYLTHINYDMSYHRLKKELKEAFNLNREEVYKRFVEQGIYKLLGETPPPQPLSHKGRGELVKLVHKYNPISPWLVWLGGFDLSNLELTGEEKTIVESVPKTIPQTDFETYNMFKDLPLESVLLYALHFDYDIALRYLENLRNIKIEINGNDLKTLGIPNGKIYKEIFDYVLEEKLKNTSMQKSDELSLVRSKYTL